MTGQENVVVAYVTELVGQYITPRLFMLLLLLVG